MANEQLPEETLPGWLAGWLLLDGNRRTGFDRQSFN